MSTQQRVLVIAGGVVLVGMMVIAAFALGVYVGDVRRSPTASDLLGRPFDQFNQPAANIPLRVLTRLPRPPDFAGEVLAVRGDTLAVRGPQGERTVSLDEFTQVYRPDGSDGAPGDVRPRQVVAVVGSPGDGGRTLVAEAIVILPPAQPPPGN